MDLPLARPRLVAWARVRSSPTRGTVLVAPEQLFRLNATAAEVLSQCDGTRTTSTIVAQLEQRHPGAPVRRDVEALLARFARRGLLTGVEPIHVGGSDDAPHEGPSPQTHGPVPVPDALLAELTYRCPLRCGYCSNPIQLQRFRSEMTTDDWRRVFDEASALDVLHAHLSGGEPLLRDDLESLVAHAHGAGLYTNLITSAFGLTEARLDALRDQGLDHVQVSLQHVDAARGDAIAGTTVHEHKVRAARWVASRGMGLSINVVLHRGNLDDVGTFIDLAADLGTQRIELANTQYHGWALANRDALIPSRAQLDRAAAIAGERRKRYQGKLTVLYVMPDYYTDVPKPCMDGWGRRFVTVIPDGRVLPCPGAHELPLTFERVTEQSLGEIWRNGVGINAFRGTDWMPEPCVSCERRDVDHGGCRCQAFALTGDVRATDPACSKAPMHGIVEQARLAAGRSATPLRFRVWG